MIIAVFDRVENNVGKRENAGYQHFLLFPQCFQKVSFPEASKGVIVWEWVKLISLASAFGELHQNWIQMCRPVNSPNVDRNQNLGPCDYGANALLREHGHHTMFSKAVLIWVINPFPNDKF